MQVNNYAVNLNAQYFSLQRDSTELKVSSQTENFESNESTGLKKIQTENFIEQQNDNELSIALSQAILKNINLESNRSTRDILELHYTYEEVQALNFEVHAYIQTDSKEITLSLNVSLSRSFVQETNISLEQLQALKDPLILSFDGNLPSLSTQTFSFDIDSDGENDQISLLNKNSAFLALDKNSNGLIDNGSELFGTVSGNGFSDLKDYDDDNNGWIDENDAIFDKLRIWQVTKESNTLIGLGEKGIGAIFLGNTSTPFSLKDQENSSLGELQSSGFFLYENGTAGLISQIDLSISKETKESLKEVQNQQKEE